MTYFSGLYGIVAQQCTVEQVRDLLREYKYVNDVTKKEIKLSANSQELIDTLRLAAGHGLVPQEKVFDLIRKSEENGHQHIFLYELKDKEAGKYRDGLTVATELFGEAFGSDYFPNFERPKESENWADFRTSLGNGRKGWLGKIYGHERISRLARRRKRDSPEGYIEILRYEYEDYSTVAVVRFRNPGLLEVRIDQTGAIRAGVIPDRKERVWGMLKGAIAPEDFRPYNLRHALTRMMVERRKNLERYKLGSIRVQDQRRGAVQFDPYDDDEEIDADQGRKVALDGLLGNRGRGSHAAVKWKACAGAPKAVDGLLTVVTGGDSSELIITAHTTAEVIDYVLDQFREFSK